MNGEVGDLAGKANGNVVLRVYERRQQYRKKPTH